ncbi:MAG: hypothetical protein J5614_08275 [Paludibacteraceae bacterium]|nr:hypothetical protein [Paludibacteraceae bacterium]
MKTKRHVDWKNVGFVVSWVCAIVSIGYIIADLIMAVFTNERILPSFKNWPGLIGLALISWCFTRNDTTISEYIDRWRERHE